nr:nuclear localization sequence-binding protein [Quercus suber]
MEGDTRFVFNKASAVRSAAASQSLAEAGVGLGSSSCCIRNLPTSVLQEFAWIIVKGGLRSTTISSTITIGSPPHLIKCSKGFITRFESAHHQISSRSQRRVPRGLPIMFAIRRSASRIISQTHSRQFLTVRPISRVTSFQPVGPSLLRCFHQSQSRLSDKDEASPAEAKVTDEAVTTEPNDSETKSTPETLSEKAKEYASSAANTVSSAASSTVAAASSAASATFEPASKHWPGPQDGVTPGTKGRIIYIGNLYFEVNVQELTNTFSALGNITNARIVTDLRGMSKGFGFVEFADQESADRAVAELDQKLLHGRRMAIQYHVQRERRSPTHVGPYGQEPRNPASKTLFIGNMSYQMSDRDLNELFRDIRNVLDVRVAIDRRTGQPRGFAHADFVDVASAEQARDTLRSKTLYGRQLRIDFSANSGRPGSGTTGET